MRFDAQRTDQTQAGFVVNRVEADGNVDLSQIAIRRDTTGNGVRIVEKFYGGEGGVRSASHEEAPPEFWRRFFIFGA